MQIEIRKGRNVSQRPRSPSLEEPSNESGCSMAALAVGNEDRLRLEPTLGILKPLSPFWRNFIHRTEHSCLVVYRDEYR